ncbi:hypothetical protein C7382_10268 [Porphyromonas loveana]|uniref:Uncharacterized protein n=2 Tax=Porphyromonas loveana TaxID=1884669 RepID=A0A2U1FPF9_9PORP|nr:hypothetical protein C7382_10268 [Porphyromonas loveana]
MSYSLHVGYRYSGILCNTFVDTDQKYSCQLSGRKSMNGVLEDYPHRLLQTDYAG